MITLPKSLSSWQSNLFKHTFKAEILALDPLSIPLHLATSRGGYIDYGNIELMILSTGEDSTHLKISTGFFFTEVVGGCNCDDDPIEANDYCTFLISINKTTSACSFTEQPE